MLRKDKLVGAIVYYDGTFPSSAFIITLCCIGVGGDGGTTHLCSYTDSAKGNSTAQSICFASEFLSVKWACTLLTTVTYGKYKRIYLFSWLVGTVICESLRVLVIPYNYPAVCDFAALERQDFFCCKSSTHVVLNFLDKTG